MECDICAVSKDRSDFPDAPLTGACEHASSTCLGCVSRAIRAHIEVDSSSNVPCPQCHGILSHGTVHRYADAETRDKYDAWCVRRILEQNPSFVWVCKVYRSLHD